MQSSRTVQEEQLRQLRIMNAQMNPGLTLLKFLFWPAEAFFGILTLCALPMFLARSGTPQPEAHSSSHLTHSARKEIK